MASRAGQRRGHAGDRVVELARRARGEPEAHVIAALVVGAEPLLRLERDAGVEAAPGPRVDVDAGGARPERHATGRRREAEPWQRAGERGAERVASDAV